MGRRRGLLDHGLPEGQGRGQLPLPVRTSTHQVVRSHEGRDATSRLSCFNGAHDELRTPTARRVPAGSADEPSDEKLWATLVHIGGIFFGPIPALIGYLVLKDRGPFVR